MRLAVAIIATQTLVGASPALLITSDGAIGPLHMDTGTRAAIVATMGRPAAERTGTWNGSRRYRAMGYDCSRAKTDDAWPLLRRGPYCRTVFFLDVRDGKLGTFYTASTRFQADGLRVGMPTAEAERLLHRRVMVGCEANVYLGDLTVAFAGGRADKDRHLVGGHVEAFALHSRRHDVGVFDCL